MTNESEKNLQSKINSAQCLSFNRLYELAKKLTSESGCPWDKMQTPMSLRAPLSEETAEAVDAITSAEVSHVKEELGDVFFNLLLIAEFYEKTGDFGIEQVFDEICEKLIRRHPHVFGNLSGKMSLAELNKNSNSQLSNSAEKDESQLKKLNEQWDKIKLNVEHRKTNFPLDEVPAGFDPLLKAYKYLSKASKSGFKIKNQEDAFADILANLEKIKTSCAQIKKNQQSQSQNAEPFTKNCDAQLNEFYNQLEKEFGAAFFSLVNLALDCKINPNVALMRANKEFYKNLLQNQNDGACGE